MITFVTGKPGDGKSLYAMRLLIKTLVTTDAYVVTNIPLKWPQLRAYVVARRPDFDLDERVRVLDDDEVPEFFRFRSGALVLPESPDAGREGKRMEKEEFRQVMKGNFMRIAERDEWCRPVHYFIDEVHDFFSARDWASNGRATLYYASKHRHLRDEIVLITQVIDNVEKQLRTLVSETYVVRNFIRRNVGAFKTRPIFRVKSYYGVPSPGAIAAGTKDYPLDAAGLAACYKTVGALGVHSEPEAIANRGFLPWWTLWAGGATLVLGLTCACWFGPRVIFGSVFSMFRQKPQAQAQVHPALPSRQSEVATAAQSVAVAPPRVAERPPEFDGEIQSASGWSVHLVGGDWEPVIAAGPRGLRVLLGGEVVRQRPTLPKPPAASMSSETQSAPVKKS